MKKRVALAETELTLVTAARTVERLRRLRERTVADSERRRRDVERLAAEKLEALDAELSEAEAELRRVMGAGL